MLPARYKNVRFENSELTEKQKELLKQIIQNKMSLLLTGKAGTGKTHFAALIYIYSKINRKIWIDANEYILELENRKRANTTDAVQYLQQWWDMVLWNELLIIDDLGAEENNEHNSSVFKRIIMNRYNHQLQTIITTNLSGEELKNRYSERIISRIYEDFTVIVMNGKDKRKEKFKEAIKL